jgi:ParB family chromosome partitioning protein
MGHARALVNLPNEETQLKVYKDVVSKNLNVRQVEELVKDLQEGEGQSPKKVGSRAQLRKPLSIELSTLLGAAVQVKEKTDGEGEIVIRYNNDQELERIVSLINP